MKTTFTTILATALLCLSGSLMAQVTQPVGVQTAPSKPSPQYDGAAAPSTERVPGGGVMTFEEETHNFGELVQGGDATWTFRFTNTGTEAITIESAHGSCGCTVPTWPKESIAPGAVGEIFVKYDSNRIGGIDKKVTIISNASQTSKEIFIKGNITPKPAEPSYLAPAQGGPANQ